MRGMKKNTKRRLNKLPSQFWKRQPIALSGCSGLLIPPHDQNHNTDTVKSRSHFLNPEWVVSHSPARSPGRLLFRSCRFPSPRKRNNSITSVNTSNSRDLSTGRGTGRGWARDGWGMGEGRVGDGWGDAAGKTEGLGKGRRVGRKHRGKRRWRNIHKGTTVLWQSAADCMDGTKHNSHWPNSPESKHGRIYVHHWILVSNCTRFFRLYENVLKQVKRNPTQHFSFISCGSQWRIFDVHHTYMYFHTRNSRTDLL